MGERQVNFIIQASSRAWGGEEDLCMKIVDGYPVVYWTLDKIIKEVSGANVVIAAPEFDDAGALEDVVKQFSGKVEIFYGYNCNPLLRMISAYDHFLSGDYFVRIDGLNMFHIPSDIEEMYFTAMEKQLDCFKYPDDYPAQVVVDIYNVNALKQVSSLLNSNSPYVVHPKYYLFAEKKFNTAFFDNMAKLTDGFLLNARNIAKQIYLEPRTTVNNKKIEIGDQLSFHYTLAAKYINKNDIILDIACGNGHGTVELAKHAKHVKGADISSEIILESKEKLRELSNNIQFQVEDVTNMSFEDNSFDVITSFETIEHVDAEPYLKEIQRVLKKQGLFILSTPQNSYGHIPINAEHKYEYSLEEIKNMTSKYFEIVEMKGLKQGCIIHENDPIGNNAFIVFKGL